MCDIDSKMDKSGNLTMVCKTSGKPIVKSNLLGMFCEDMCDYEDAKKAEKLMEKMLGYVKF
jgi:hypothetical protein